MTKCEHHEDYIKLHEGIRDHIDRVEKGLERRINDTDRKLDTAFNKLDDVRDDINSQGRDYTETAAYVKTLYRRFDELTSQMQSVVIKMDQYIATMAVVKSETDNNSKFSQSGKDLVKEVIKYIVIAGVGYALATNGS